VPALTAQALDQLPEVQAGDDLAGLLVAAAPDGFGPADVLVVAHKVVSKAEGRVRDLADVEPTPRARELAGGQDKDARLVQVVLDESAELLRAHHGVLICLTHHGFVCANAGVDRSNTGGEDQVVLLPADPDASARALREALPGRPAVVISDSFGRAWRVGQTDVAVGAAGLVPLDDWRGRRDSRGRELEATEIAVGDSVAAAADLARAKDGATPAVVVRGLERFVTADDGPGAAALRRPPALDLFR
jgi:coenzyme F420-0:L-glutamate ligase/coenzyme F420-1:gamma-L-glutamate ligase